MSRENPAPITRLIYEKSLFPDDISHSHETKTGRDYLFFDSANFEISNLDFFTKELFEIQSFLKKCLGPPENRDRNVEDFVKNYCIMFREQIRRRLLNLTRQHRSFKRYFLDCQVMLDDALVANEHISTVFKRRFEMANSPILFMAVNLNVDA